MNRYILDTDHLTLLKRNHPVIRAKISSNDRMYLRDDRDD
jgi:hypothetical protein